jgi:hypothetical protein
MYNRSVVGEKVRRVGRSGRSVRYLTVKPTSPCRSERVRLSGAFGLILDKTITFNHKQLSIPANVSNHFANGF